MQGWVCQGCCGTFTPAPKSHPVSCWKSLWGPTADCAKAAQCGEGAGRAWLHGQHDKEGEQAAPGSPSTQLCPQERGRGAGSTTGR